MYKEFLQKNDTFERRVDALTSGILSPDTKALTLWAMEPGEPYTRSNLHRAVQEFAGGEFPITKIAVWKYCNGAPRKKGGWYDGALYSIGAVVKDELVFEGEEPEVAYIKTDAGTDFGEPLAALATVLVNKIASAKNKPPYISMQRIIGMPSTSGMHRHGYSVYRIVKLLAENPEREFREQDIVETTELEQAVVSRSLNSLGAFGIIDYYSPHRDSEGKWTRGWSAVCIDESIRSANPEQVYTDFRKTKGYFGKKTGFITAFRFCQEHAGEELNRNQVAKECRIRPTLASNHLSVMRELGFAHGTLKGGEKQTIARANDFTAEYWAGLFQDVGRVAQEVQTYSELCRALDRYRKDDSLREEHVGRHLKIYEMERVCGRIGLAEAAAAKILAFMSDGAERKRSHIKEYLKNKGIDLACQSIHSYLHRLKDSGCIEKTRRGYYRLVREAESV